jgi:hypothetical protein
MAEKSKRMTKTKEQVTTNDRATFYAVLWHDFRLAAREKGWALALHGSMASDLDIMAMPWTEDARPIDEVISAINDCIGKTVWKETNLKPFIGKPHGRIVYTICIMGDWYIDISVMPSAVCV